MMMAPRVVIERMGDSIIAVHRVFKPRVIDPGGYVQVTSFEAFRRRQSESFHKKYLSKSITKDTHWFHIMFLDEWQLHWKFSYEWFEERGKHNPEYDNTQWLVHWSVWDFYQSVGWDHKKKRLNTL